MTNLINYAESFIELYIEAYDERVNEDNLVMIFNTDNVMYDFEEYLNQYDIDLNKKVKSHYVRYCNKYYKEQYGSESCIKYNISNRKLTHHILYTQSMYMRQYIIDILKDNDLWDGEDEEDEEEEDEEEEDNNFVNMDIFIMEDREDFECCICLDNNNSCSFQCNTCKNSLICSNCCKELMTHINLNQSCINCPICRVGKNVY